jgi:hypothetical protein
MESGARKQMAELGDLGDAADNGAALQERARGAPAAKKRHGTDAAPQTLTAAPPRQPVPTSRLGLHARCGRVARRQCEAARRASERQAGRLRQRHAPQRARRLAARRAAAAPAPARGCEGVLPWLVSP